MGYKDKDKQRQAQNAYAKRRYAETGGSIAKDYKLKKKQLVRDHKSVPCLDCGASYPYYVMDLDHREGVDKVDAVSRMVVQYGMAKLKSELEKCDVVCANCHRERTHRRGHALVV